MEDFKKHQAAQERSGQSISEYCRQHGISAKRFYYWRERVREDRKFVEVGSSGNTGFELKVREGLTLVVPPKFDTTALKRLLQALEC